MTVASESVAALPQQYDVFLSYSQKPDRPLASALQGAIGSFGLPWYNFKVSALSIFRDDTGLSMDEDLWAAIEKAIRASSRFVLLASPEAAQSSWVRREVALWLSLDRGLPYIVITDGTFEYDSAMARVGADTDCLPPALAERIVAEPLFLDMRWARQEASSLQLKDDAFRDAVVTLSAALRGLRKEQVYSQALRVQRRNLQLASGGLLMLLALLAISIRQTFVARTQTHRATELRTIAEVNEHRATVSQHQAEENERQVKQNLAVSIRAQAERYLSSGQPSRAAPLFADALERGLDDRNTRLGFAAAMQLLPLTLRHDGVALAAFSPDGRKLVTAGRDATTRLWDAQAGTLIGEPIKHDHWVTAVEFFSDSTRLAVADKRRRFKIIDTADGHSINAGFEGFQGIVAAFGLSAKSDRFVFMLGNDDAVQVADATSGIELTERSKLGSQLFGDGAFTRFCDDDRAFITMGTTTIVADRPVRLWNATSASPLGPAIEAGRTLLGLSLDCKRMLTNDDEHTVKLWDTLNGRALLTELETRDAAMDSRGEHVVTIDKTGRTRVWSAASGALQSSLKLPTGVRRVALNRDGSLALFATTEDAQVFDLQSGQARTRPMRHGRQISSIVWTPDDRLVATGGSQSARVWDARSGAPSTPLLEHLGTTQSVTFSQDSRRLLVRSDSAVHVWELPSSHDDSGRPTPSVHFENWSLSAGSSFVLAHNADEVAVYSADNLQTPRWMAHRGNASSAGFSPDGKEIVIAANGGVGVYDTATGSTVFEAPLRDTERVIGVAVSANILMLLTVTVETQENHMHGGEGVRTIPKAGKLRLWDIRTRQKLDLRLAWNGRLSGAVLSASGSHVLVTESGRAELVETATGNVVSPELKLLRKDGLIVAATLNANGTRALLADDDKRVGLWSLPDGTLLNTMEHDDRLAAARFSPDQASFVTVQQRSIRIWNAVDGSARTPLLEHPFTPEAAAISSDGLRVLSASRGVIRVWDITSAALAIPPRLGPDDGAIVFGDDGLHILYAGQGATELTALPQDPGAIETWRARLANLPYSVQNGLLGVNENAPDARAQHYAIPTIR